MIRVVSLMPKSCRMIWYKGEAQRNSNARYQSASDNKVEIMIECGVLLFNHRDDGYHGLAEIWYRYRSADAQTVAVASIISS